MIGAGTVANQVHRSQRQFVGIDPGKRGGIVVIDGECRRLFSERLRWIGVGKRARLDLDRLTSVLRGEPDELALRLQGVWDPVLILERPEEQQRGVRSRGSGAQRIGGEQLGAISALCHAHNIAMRLVRATDWSPHMLRGRVRDVTVDARPGETETDRRARRQEALREERKAAALLLAKELWPDLPIEHKADDGIADAALLAEYGRLCHLAQVFTPDPKSLKEVEVDG
jgi:hypothetical protein